MESYVRSNFHVIFFPPETQAMSSDARQEWHEIQLVVAAGAAQLGNGVRFLCGFTEFPSQNERFGVSYVKRLRSTINWGNSVDPHVKIEEMDSPWINVWRKNNITLSMILRRSHISGMTEDRIANRSIRGFCGIS